jgi:hypothetical protein
MSRGPHDDAIWTALQLVHVDVLGEEEGAVGRFVGGINDPVLLRKLAIVLVELVGHVFENYVPPEEHERRIEELVRFYTPDTPEDLT